MYGRRTECAIASTSRPAEVDDGGSGHFPANTSGVQPLIDGCGRRVDHLRLSVTSRCDLSCCYCRPSGEAASGDQTMLLTDDMRLELIRFLYKSCGLSQVRLTGGEPLIHPTIVEFIRRIRLAAPRVAITMTTNGQLLSHLAGPLRSAGLDRLNVSLDSLSAETYQAITGGRLAAALDAIAAAFEAGFPSPRINVVVLRGLNEDELADLTRWGIRNGCEVRFLEAMPIGAAACRNQTRVVPAREVLRRLRVHFELQPLSDAVGSTARRYLIRSDAGVGVIGLIAPITRPFCASCRRIRLSADGKLYPCLLDSRHIRVHAAWNSGCFDPDTALRLIENAITGKQPQGPLPQTAAMLTLGG